MKKSAMLTIGLIVVTLIAVVVIIMTQALGTGAPPPTPTPTNTNIPSPTPTQDVCAPQNREVLIREFDRNSREFNDAFLLAQNTPAAQLSTVITDMQRIRRNAEYYSVPGCLDTLKEYQLGFMNTAIEASMILYSSFSSNQSASMSQEQVTGILENVYQLLDQAREYDRRYTTEMASLLGITLTPVPETLIPAGTPEVGATPTP